MPPRIQATNTSGADPRVRAMSLVTRKTPEPMVSPMTTAVAAQRPRPRMRSDRSTLTDEGELMEKEARDYYLQRGWSIDSSEPVLRSGSDYLFALLSWQDGSQRWRH